jgi:hypothetical protein
VKELSYSQSSDTLFMAEDERFSDTAAKACAWNNSCTCGISETAVAANAAHKIERHLRETIASAAAVDWWVGSSSPTTIWIPSTAKNLKDSSENWKKEHD